MFRYLFIESPSTHFFMTFFLTKYAQSHACVAFCGLEYVLYHFLLMEDSFVFVVFFPQCNQLSCPKSLNVNTLLVFRVIFMRQVPRSKIVMSKDMKILLPDNLSKELSIYTANSHVCKWSYFMSINFCHLEMGHQPLPFWNCNSWSFFQNKHQ